MTPTPGPWRLGNGDTIVADMPITGGALGTDDVAYYGGHLIGESVAPCNRSIIAAAPTLAALLRRYLDNHAANADAEGMSARCDCRLCTETRAALAPIDERGATA
jgi:hypothetical protein